MNDSSILNDVKSETIHNEISCWYWQRRFQGVMTSQRRPVGLILMRKKRNEMHKRKRKTRNRFSSKLEGSTIIPFQEYRHINSASHKDELYLLPWIFVQMGTSQ